MKKEETIKSLLASIAVILIFVIAWFLFDLGLRLLDTLRGQRSFLQDLFRTLLAPGLATYIAILVVDKIFPTYNKKLVLYIFSAIFILFTLVALYLMIPVAKQAGFGFFDFFVQLLTPIIVILTAYLTFMYR
ncbi:MAG TPA: hypothetical protein PK564_03170 [bacterium]|jgi:hypothetical protein|nr:hypothetical protein [bacterium]